MNIQEIKAIISQITYRDWQFRIEEKNNVPFLQVQFYENCSETGIMSLQSCRKWQLSYFMIPSEIVRTAYKAIEAAVIHEFQEQFRYKNVQIYNPHIDLDAMVDFVKNTPIVGRT